MARSKAEIEEEIARLSAELAETAEEMEEVIDEAVEETEEVIEDAAEEATDDVVEAIEETAEQVEEDAPLVDDAEDAERAIAQRVIADLEERYELVPRTVVEHTEHHTEHYTEGDPVEESPPVSEHWTRRRIF